MCGPNLKGKPMRGVVKVETATQYGPEWIAHTLSCGHFRVMKKDHSGKQLKCPRCPTENAKVKAAK